VQRYRYHIGSRSATARRFSAARPPAAEMQRAMHSPKKHNTPRASATTGIWNYKPVVPAAGSGSLGLGLPLPLPLPTVNCELRRVPISKWTMRWHRQRDHGEDVSEGFLQPSGRWHRQWDRGEGCATSKRAASPATWRGETKGVTSAVSASSRSWRPSSARSASATGLALLPL
jgi:hypothetical protein